MGSELRFKYRTAIILNQQSKLKSPVVQLVAFVLVTREILVQIQCWRDIRFFFALHWSWWLLEQEYWSI